MASASNSEKASRNVSNWDHDDFHYFGPILSEEAVRQLAAIQGGAEQKTSIAGLKNTYAGFNNYVSNTFKYLDEAVSNNDIENADANSRRMINLMRSYIRFDSIMSSRFEPNSLYTRLGKKELETFPGVDNSRYAIEHKNELNTFIGALCREIGLGEQWDAIMAPVNLDNAAGLAQRSNRIKEFGEKLEGQIKNYIDQHKFSGFNELIQRIQSGTVANRPLVQGILSKPKTKVSKEEIESGKISMAAYERPELKDKVQRLRDLQSGKGIKSKEQIEAENSARLQRVIQLIDAGQYPQVSSSDVELLDNTIQRIEASARGESGEPAKPKKKR